MQTTSPIQLSKAKAAAALALTLSLALGLSPRSSEALGLSQDGLSHWQRCLRATGANKALEQQGGSPEWEANAVLCKEAVRLEVDPKRLSPALGAMARAYQGMGQLDTAVSLYRQAIELEPSLSIHFSLAEAYRKKGEPGEAVVVYQSMLRRWPEELKARLELAKTYEEMGRMDAALVSYKAGAAGGSENEEAYLGVAEVYERMGRWDEALDAYQEALKANPESAPAYTGMGRVYMEMGRPEEAEASLKEAVRLDPKLAEAHYQLGRVFVQTGWVEGGINSLQKAVHLDQELADAYYSLGIAYSTMDRRALADDYLHQAAEMYLERGNRKKALEAYGQLRSLQSPLAEKVYLRLYPR